MVSKCRSRLLEGHSWTVVLLSAVVLATPAACGDSGQEETREKPESSGGTAPAGGSAADGGEQIGGTGGDETEGPRAGASGSGEGGAPGGGTGGDDEVAGAPEAPGGQGSAEFEGLPLTTSGTSHALGVSADGTTVVGYADPGSNNEQPFRWTADSGLEVFPEIGFAEAASADGSMIAGSRKVNQTRLPYRWTRDDGFVTLELPEEKPTPDRAFTSGVASALSASGEIVVGSLFDTSDQQYPFRWSSNGMEVLALPADLNPRKSANATAVSADGTVIAGVLADRPHFHVFRWTESDGMVFIDDISSEVNTNLSDLSADGAVIVGWVSETTSDALHPLRWTLDEGLTILELPFCARAYADATNADGTVVAVHCESAQDNDVYLWTPDGKLRSLSELLEAGGADLTGWELEVATAMSADAKVLVGNGWNPDGEKEAWIARLP